MMSTPVFGNYSIREVLMRRDGLSSSEAEEMINEAKGRVQDGEDPEEILSEDFGLEPDYLFDLL